MAENKYQRGKIYRILSDQTDQVYIGSTTEPTLACRMSKHRDHYRRYLAGNYHRVTAFDVLQHPDAQIILIEYYPCQNKDELLARERLHIENTPTCVNRNTPGRTTKEYYQDNKERIAVHQKEYYHDNKETIAAYQKEYRKAYWATHKEVIARKASQPHNCLCGGKYITSTKARHEKSPKHQAYLQQAKKVDELLNQFVQELGL